MKTFFSIFISIFQILTANRSIFLNEKCNNGQKACTLIFLKIIFLAPKDLKMKEQFQVSMFFEKQNKNSKNQTTNQTFSFKTGDMEIYFHIANTCVSKSKRNKQEKREQSCRYYSQDFLKAEVACTSFPHHNQQV